MKKYIALLLMSAALLCGCSERTDKAQAEKLAAVFGGPFGFTACYEANGVEGELEFRQYALTRCELTILSPESLCGCSYSLEDGVVKETLQGIHVEAAQQELGKRSIFAMLCGMCTALPSAEPQLSENGGVLTADYGEFSITARDGIPLRLEFPGASLELTSFDSGE